MAKSGRNAVIPTSDYGQTRILSVCSRLILSISHFGSVRHDRRDFAIRAKRIVRENLSFSAVERKQTRALQVVERPRSVLFAEMRWRNRALDSLFVVSRPSEPGRAPTRPRSRGPRPHAYPDSLDEAVRRIAPVFLSTRSAS